jgi:hypothetical protein
LRKKKAGRGLCGSERRGGAGWASREAEAQWGGGEEASWGGMEVAAAGPKTGVGPKFKKKIHSNFIWNLDFWQTLEICTRRFRRNFDKEIFPKIF